MTEEELQQRRERHETEMQQIRQAIEHSRATVEDIRQGIHQSRATVEQMRIQNDKLSRETQWYPLVVGSGATLAIVAIVKLFL